MKNKEPMIEGFDWGKATKPLKDIGNNIAKGLKNTGGKIKKGYENTNKEVNKAAKDVNKKATKAIDDALKSAAKPMKGIEKTISDFFNYVDTFNKTLGPRFNNVFSGIEVIFVDGIKGELQTLTDSIGSGFKTMGWLFAGSGELVRTYIMCGIKFIKNIYFCIFFYIFQILFYIIYLPVWLVMWSLKKFVGIDVFWIETRTWDGLRIVDGYTWHWLGFHIIYWPKNVRERCFTCVRLKKSVVNNIGAAVDYNFNERISKASGTKMKWAERVSAAHMKEAVKWPDVDNPKKVRNKISKYKEPPIDPEIKALFNKYD